MVRVATTAKFPATLLALADIGLFTNDEDLILTADATNAATTFSCDDVTQFAVGMWLPVRGMNGLEICQVTAVDIALKTVTVSRAQDGTTAIAHSQGERGIAGVPAKALNQMRDELIAHATFLTPSGGAWTPGSVLFIGATGNLEQDNTNFFYADATNQLRLAATGSSAGLLIGGDAHLYRGAANRLDLASGDSLNIVLGNLQMAAVTLFESDRDLAVDLLPNADNTLHLGSAARRFNDLYLGPSSLHILAAASDANDLLHVGSAGFQMGAGGASALDVTLKRQAASIYETTGSLAGSVRWGMSGAATPFLALRLAAADAEPLVALLTDRVAIGAGGATAADYSLIRTGANVGELTGTLTGGVDNTYDIGSSAHRYQAIVGMSHEVFAGPGDAVPMLKTGTVGLEMGPGGASALDVGLDRRADSMWWAYGALAGDVRFGMSAANTPVVELRVNSGQEPDSGLYKDRLSFGPGNVTVFDVTLSRSAANELSLASGDTLLLATDGTTGGLKFGASGDVHLYRSAASILAMPSGDSLALLTDGNTGGLLLGAASDVLLYRGAANRAYFASGDGLVLATDGNTGGVFFGASADVQLYRVAQGLLGLESNALAGRLTFGIVGGGDPVISMRAATADAQPFLSISNAGLRFGAGGATSVDVTLSRGAANRLDLSAADHLQIPSGDLRFDSATNGIILKDAAGTPHYWRVTVDATGALVTIDLGTNLPAT